MGFSEEFYYKSDYKRLWAILNARNKYNKENASAAGDTDNEALALKRLDNFLG